MGKVPRMPERCAWRGSAVCRKRFDPLPVNEAVADSCGRLADKTVSQGHQSRRRVMDLLIAATAHAHSASLYTCDADDLRGLEDLIDIISV